MTFVEDSRGNLKSRSSGSFLNTPRAVKPSPPERAPTTISTCLFVFSNREPREIAKINLARYSLSVCAPGRDQDALFDVSMSPRAENDTL
ncbi:hypothetical protein CDAR_10031 [Caerostris darwini]|uniref:Uncharacterized protein n=1 Tax=Caerostris darwini TaxID=1538125 RepID=A0AAV4UB73_9ARAC|nr:hypothetical protein CDAR_10031 [Caerostris darwini]